MGGLAGLLQRFTGPARAAPRRSLSVLVGTEAVLAVTLGTAATLE